MKDDIVPDEHHVSRYARKASIDIESGIIAGSAFSLRHERGEKTLSVNWLEYFGAISIKEAVDHVRQAFLNKNFKLSTGSKFVVLNVEILRNYVKKETAGTVNLSVLHMPSASDKSHSEIFGIPEDSMLVEELLAETINYDNVFPAR